MITRFSKLYGCLHNRNQLPIILLSLLAPLSIATASTMPFSGATSGIFSNPNFIESFVAPDGSISHQDVSQTVVISGFGSITTSFSDRVATIPAAI